MYETKEAALATWPECAESVEYCDCCEAWTVVLDDGYPICYCA